MDNTTQSELFKMLVKYHPDHYRWELTMAPTLVNDGKNGREQTFRVDENSPIISIVQREVFNKHFIRIIHGYPVCDNACEVMTSSRKSSPFRGNRALKNKHKEISVFKAFPKSKYLTCVNEIKKTLQGMKNKKRK